MAAEITFDELKKRIKDAQDDLNDLNAGIPKLDKLEKEMADANKDEVKDLEDLGKLDS